MRTTLFMRTTLWKDLLQPGLDLTVFAQRNREDRSRLVWTELRRRFERTDFALQGQFASGPAASQYGGMTERRLLQALVTHYF